MEDKFLTQDNEDAASEMLAGPALGPHKLLGELRPLKESQGTWHALSGH